MTDDKIKPDIQEPVAEGHEIKAETTAHVFVGSVRKPHKNSTLYRLDGTTLKIEKVELIKTASKIIDMNGNRRVDFSYEPIAKSIYTWALTKGGAHKKITAFIQNHHRNNAMNQTKEEEV